MRYWSECGNFIRESRRHFRDTGALLPSSPFLARALVAELRKPRSAGRILEVGPGTGSVTQQILRHLLPVDRLDAVDVNKHFLELLGHRLEEEWAPWHRPGQVRLVHAAIQDLADEEGYDFIVSGLPLNSLSGAQVRDIFRAYARLLRPGGTLTYYEYVFIRQLTRPFVNRRERRRLYRVGRVVGRYIRAYQVRRQQVLMNVPPAIVRHLRLKPRASGAVPEGRAPGAPTAAGPLQSTSRLPTTVPL